MIFSNLFDRVVSVSQWIWLFLIRVQREVLFQVSFKCYLRAPDVYYEMQIVALLIFFSMQHTWLQQACMELLPHVFCDIWTTIGNYNLWCHFRACERIVRSKELRCKIWGTNETCYHLVWLPITRHRTWLNHYGDVIMGTMASQITSLTIVYSTVY